MDIVVKLPDKDYQVMLTKVMLACYGCEIIELSKGHGRIGDLDKLKANIEEYRDTYDRNGDDYEFGKYTAYDMSIDAIDETPIIIEADRSEEE